MKCYICNRETSSFRRDPDGKYVSICSVCRSIINEHKYVYEDITDEDIKILKMTSKDFDKHAKEVVK